MGHPSIVRTEISLPDHRLPRGVCEKFSLGLQQFNQQIHLGHEPRDLAHPKRHGRNGTTQKKGSEPGKMLDGPTDIRHLVTNMVNTAALFEGAVYGRVRPKRGHQFYHRLSASAAQKANGDILDWIVERARRQFVAEKVSKNWNCLLEISHSNSKVMKIKLFHANL